MAEAKRLERLKAMRSLLKSEMEKSETFSLVLNKTGSKIEEINHKLLSLEADLKVERWKASPFSDHIRHTIAPISAVLRVFSTVQELERSLVSSSEVLGYVSDVKRLGEAMKLLSSSCVLALNWLEDTIEYLTEKGMPEDHPCGLRFKTSIELLRELQMTEPRAYLKGGILYTALKNLETEFKRILKEEQVLSKDNLRKLQAIIKRLHAHTRLKNCVSVYVKVRTTVIQKRFEIGYLEKTITEADNVHDIEGDIDQWRSHMEIAVREIYEFESKLSYDVFDDVGEDVPLRCFGEIASNSRILPLLRFGSRISKCKKDPPKLLKLLDCFYTMDNIRIEFNRIFQGEQCSEVRRVTRELISNLVKGVCEIFWELPSQVELQRPNCPPLDGGVPRLVSVVTEYCNKLLGNNNKPILSKILEIDLGWKNTKYQEELLTGHIYNILREIALNLDAWSSSNKETALSCIFMMNNHSHFCGLRETHLGEMMGESWLNAHEQYRDYYAALYVKESWGNLLSLLTTNKSQTTSSSSSESSPVKRKRARESIKRTLQAFSKGFDEIFTKQSNWVVEDDKLAWKICQAMVKTVVPRYKSYLQSYIKLLVEEDPTSDSKHLYYTPKGLEMKLKTMFQKKEETEKRGKDSHFVNKVMDLEITQNSHMTLEAI
ncbi:Cullin repeat-like-containing domain superfamily [Arabidopsis thaliana x Arabidopsis arenosa]|uniref:Exocyst subunit Exo70 family protein n=1 Tax=Arabidopsis thaliana x Arabidopsis arenosa TaxID=1240361 RepID=A0A8T2C704_9BRAS|nr:Cullin repeat-like-containing domain superfamily [Arabidopsis thaliana x Arabidopsis arenosa]